MPRYEVTVQITTQDTTTAEVSNYVEDAVKGWAGPLSLSTRSAATTSTCAS
jgi:hypothetical protein